MPRDDLGQVTDILNKYNLLKRTKRRLKSKTVLTPYGVSGEQVKRLYKSGCLRSFPATASIQLTLDHDQIHRPSTFSVCETMLP
jgi:hypothetical protein